MSDWLEQLSELEARSAIANALAKLERENEQLREREEEQRQQLNHIESYCSDYVDDITTSHKMIRGICEVIGMEWEGRS